VAYQPLEDGKMSYTERLIVTISPDLLDIGRSITRALDVDVGGYNSWTPVRDDPADAESLIVAYVADTPCTAEFKAQALAMLAQPELLHAAVSADYTERWADFEAPTLEECAAFCAGAVLPVEVTE
jgi:hypothetical protein